MAICLPGIASRVNRAPTSAFGTLGDHDGLDHDQDEEDDRADDDAAADRDLAEGLDHLAGIALAEHEPRGGDIEAQPEQGRDQQDRREHREVERPFREHRGEQHHQREDDVDGDQRVEHPGGHGHHQQQDDPDNAERDGNKLRVLRFHG
jgi:hypothetical protein